VASRRFEINRVVWWCNAVSCGRTYVRADTPDDSNWIAALFCAELAGCRGMTQQTTRTYGERQSPELDTGEPPTLDFRVTA
jgi:hypothetical protein